MTRSVEERWIPEETFGDRLRRVRRALGLNQEAFASQLGADVGVKALGAWETGTREPRGAVSVARRIELAFGVPAAWLLGLDVPGPTGPDGGTDLYPAPSRLVTGHLVAVA
jgi:transcriptional regulator with XRE-family HTH domain